MGGMKNAYKILTGKCEERDWSIILKRSLNIVWCDCVQWIYLLEDRGQWTR
jgi:hypothetical protein